MVTKKSYALLSGFDSTILEELKNNIDFATQFLEDEGLDVSEEMNFGAKKIAKLKFLCTAREDEKRDKHLLDTAFEKLKDAIQANNQLAINALKSLLKEKAPALQYRKLEQWSAEEIRDVLGDIDLIRLMEELQNKDR